MIALVQYSMPVMVIILAAAISHIDVDYERAATSLGASPLNVFLRVTLPLSAPGIISGFITIFAWTLSAFATPQLVGGGKVNMISNMVYNMGFSNFDFPFAAVLSMIGAAADHGAARADPLLGPALRADRAALMKRVDAPRAVERGLGPVLTLILIYMVVPSLVVIMASFNDKAILSFPPRNLSWRWFNKALNYEDFRNGFYNGLIVTAWASGIALVVGTTFAYAIDRFAVPRQAGAGNPAAVAAGDPAFHGRARPS